MHDVLTRTLVQHDWRLVVLAVTVCFLTCLIAVGLFHRARGGSQRSRLTWIMAGGIICGSGIWATDLTGLMAFQPQQLPRFTIGWTMLSLIVGMAVIGIGYALALFTPMRWRAAAGGTVLGAGFTAIQVLALAALNIPGSVELPMNVFVATLGICVALSVTALGVAVRRHHLAATLLATLLLAAAVLIQHATAMSGLVVEPGAAPGGDSLALSSRVIGLLIAAIVPAMIGLGFGLVYFDLRLERRLAAHNRALDAALNNMSQGLCMFDADARLVVSNKRYCEIYGLAPKDVRPGVSLRELLVLRRVSGTFAGDPDPYCDEVKRTVAKGETVRQHVELADGRVIDLVNQPTEDGGWVATHEDITVRRSAERELDRTRSFLDTVIDNIPVTIVVKHAREHRYALINRAAEELYGVKRADMLGKTVRELLPQQQAALVIQHDDAVTNSGEPVFVDTHPLSTHAGTRLVTAKRIAIYDADGQPQYVVGVIEDVTERKQAEAKIAHMAHHDELTGLPNRAAFLSTLDVALTKAAENDASIGVICVDLERYKEINDVVGHAVGDRLLREVSRRFEEAAQGAFVARVGGDEFNVISTDGPQPATAEALAGRLMAALDDDMIIDDHRLRVGCSMGVAVFPSDSADAATLLAHADSALGQAKAEARGSIRFFEPGMDEQQRERRTLTRELRGAIERNELELFYQPQARLDGAVIGFEALVRWRHPERGMVSPAAFIPLAEESGLIVPMSEWILREACREAASWPQPLSIAINLSPVQFQHGDLPALLHEILLETGLPVSRLELEITEGVLIGDYARAISILRRLKTLGVRIAMDDFGTGYSSLSYLQAFPIDKIKIDQSFVANLGHSPQSAAIIRAMIGLGRGLDLPVVAEGVETRDQLDFLAREGCSEVQGYLIGRPRPIGDYAAEIGRSAKSTRLKAVS